MFNKEYNKTTIIINGGLGLIGQEIVKALLQLGSNVIIIDNDPKKIKLFKFENKKFQKNFKILNIDSASEIGVKKIMQYISDIEKVDAFINVSYPKDKLWNKNNFSEITLASLLKNIKLNSISYLWLTREIAEKMKLQKRGSIILFNSIYGVNGQDLSIYKGTNLKENITYSFVKGGLVNFTKQMASYYGKYNVRINSISPGGVRENNKIFNNRNFLKNYTSKVPLKRFCEISDIVPMVLLLTSENSSYITGTNILIDGGWSAI